MIVLVDYNLTGYVIPLRGTLAAEGWLDLVPIQFVLLEEVGLAMDSSDRVIWNFAQTHQMLILTANRNAKGQDSLEQTMREVGTLTSLPIITIASLDRLIESEYREQCAARLVEIALYIENYLGVGRLFIP